MPAWVVGSDPEPPEEEARGHILTALAHLTKREGESYDDFITRAAQDPIARRVKLADLEDNMDVRRLQEVASEDAKRLAKYCQAWRRLKAIKP